MVQLQTGLAQRTNPLLVIVPGPTITFGVLAMNVIGDGLRDGFDPRSGMGARLRQPPACFVNPATTFVASQPDTFEAVAGLGERS